ncbi:MAG: hypothetical protein R2718_05170 [Solirubrobacterales bacterium]
MSSAAVASIYWSDGFESAIGRSNLSGGAIEPKFVKFPSQADPAGIAVDGSHIYAAIDRSFEPDSIGRADLDGGGVDANFITGVSEPQDIAVGNDHIYWSSGFPGPEQIGRADLDGGGADPAFITGTDSIEGIAVDSQHIYWAKGDAIARANLNGTGVDQSFIAGTSAASDVAVDAGHVYWTNSFGSNAAIGRAGLDGSSPDQAFIRGADQQPPISFSPQALAVDGSYVYASTPVNGFLDGAGISRTGLNGNGLDVKFIGGDGGDFPLTSGLAVDSLNSGGGTGGDDAACRKAKKKLEKAKKKVRRAKKKVRKAAGGKAKAKAKKRLKKAKKQVKRAKKKVRKTCT